MVRDLKLPQTFLIMSFRYALGRNTSAPWEVCTQIKNHWKDIDSEFKRQIVEDIKFYKKLKKDETDYYRKLSVDFADLLHWIEHNTES